ncbi:unnamed protein product [Adineta steineri]|uniref:Uncharacterized protein n=1 Tax=Adineta steineri TaxID=433720 RepID=A0A819S6D4_9BILA|nr:unnamed protein product [Adineta steineri]CAF4054067.1 unnamed protein product [Adineta steineri]
MIYEFGKHNGIINLLSLSSGGSIPWSPLTVNETYPTKNITKLKNLHSLIQDRFAQVSIGHGLWEDSGSISYSIERLNIFDTNFVIMHLTLWLPAFF